ncbi:mitochondrial import inner membrane translocase subunit Tim9 [Carex littledalei]|uniref:Mitochondrial import inner membrane translocase subunit Tim9 n=1 Tax=Carex littledalei TaxID=544730 RepID=A0A833VJA5_9POAL|nr:mitochondrial import inner membrane translocase subunit Tim9 [Carex littledalei]
MVSSLSAAPMARRKHQLLSLLFFCVLAIPVYSRLTPNPIIQQPHSLDIDWLLKSNGGNSIAGCEQTYGFLPCTETVLGNLFLILVYGFLTFKMSCCSRFSVLELSVGCFFPSSVLCLMHCSYLILVHNNNVNLRMYNSLVEKCFTDCVDTFRRKTLDKQEETCVKRCAEKFLKHSMRVGMRFAELNQGAATSD